MEELMLQVLIADDDAGDRRQVARALRQSGLHVTSCETASVEEALQACERESFDLAIVDYRLPGQDGLSGISRLHDLYPAMVILMVTGHGDVMVATEAMKRGASDYLPKVSITPESISRAVENALDKKRLQQTVARQRQELIRLEAERHAAELRTQMERAAESDRVKTRALELRDEFLSHVSHELRAPLAAITAFSSIIEDGIAGPTTDEQKEYLDIIQKNAKQLELMIEDLLSVRASQTGKLRIDLQQASLGQAVQDALRTCEAKAKTKGVALSAEAPAPLAAAFADPMRLVQVLIILCDNAIKFTPAGGSVQVRVRERDSRHLLVEVVDSGCGIKPELTERIFDHLYQVADAHGSGRPGPGKPGLGLGLHIAKELVTMQGGEIWAESMVGVGSRFFFTVPVFVAAERAESEHAVPRQAAA